MNYLEWMLAIDILAILWCFYVPFVLECGWLPTLPGWGSWPSGFRFSVNVEWRVA